MKPDFKYTLITGASMGLGREFAIACARKGLNLVLVSLPGEKLDILAKFLSYRYKIRTVYFETDLTRKEALLRLYEQIKLRYPVNMIINNAGFGGSRHFESSPLEYLDNMIQLNIRAVSFLIRLMIPELKRHSRAWIMNISSMAAFTPMPFKTIYPATKAFVYFFSRGLSAELKESNISVSVVHPGPIMTNDEVTERIRKHGAMGRICLVSAEKIASISLRKMLRGRKVIIPGILNNLNWLLMKWLPVSLCLTFSRRMVLSELPAAEKNSGNRFTLPVLLPVQDSATAG
jgi:hypothetical protein